MRNIEDIIVNGRTLKDILEKDSYVDLSGANLSDSILTRVNLSGTNLTGTCLRGANLRGANLESTRLTMADLRDTDLTDAYLRGANLSDSKLTRTDLIDAILVGANLTGANLRGANLSHANLRGTDLSLADLRDTDLTYAYLRGANLTDANLIGASLVCAELRDSNLAGAKLNDTNEYIIGKMINEPIIGYKVCRNGIIVTLEIPKGAIVFSINGHKCRTNKAKVISIDDKNRAFSSFNNMSYYVGDEITVYNFNCMYNVECGEGIHFFLTREEAERYFIHAPHFMKRPFLKDL